jgi:signal peptidase II
MGIVCAVTIFDQITKLIVRKYTCLRVNGFLSIEYSENTGAAWNVFSGHASILAAFGVGAMVAIILFRKSFEGARQKLAWAMIFGGILGNTIDRIVRGYVVDFISIDLQFYRWPTFNVADSFLFIGVAILLFTFQKKAQKAN